MSDEIWTPTPKTEWEQNVLEIESTDRVRTLPDGRIMRESRLTLSEEWVEEMWAGYRCARCLERQDEAYPKHCRAHWCHFPMRELQRRQLEQDFIEQQPEVLAGFLDRERAYLEEKHHVKKPLMSVPKKLT